MKRDWDLIRKHLTDIEEERNVLDDFPDEPKWNDSESWEEYEPKLKVYQATEARLAGHLELLIDNGYIEGLHIQRGADGHVGVSVLTPRLTMSGHDLLDTMRSQTVWESIKANAKSKGIELTFDAIKALGALALKQLIG